MCSPFMTLEQILTVKYIFVALQYTLKWLSPSPAMINVMLHAVYG